MRLLLDNVMDDNSSITATNETTTLPASNIAKEGKTLIFRATSTGCVITVNWTTDQTINMVAIPWANFSSTTTVRVRLLNSAGTQLQDAAASTTYVYPAPKVRGLASGVNSFPFGGAGSYVYWFPSTSTTVRKMEITIASNTANVEIARVVCGKYIEPTVAPDVGASVIYDDLSVHERAESGDLRTSRNPKHRKIRIDLQRMKTTDRVNLWDLMRSNGYSAPLFFSMLPTSSQKDEVAMLHAWCKLAAPAGLTYQFVDSYSANLELEEM